jgi:hypothetical protein
MALTSIDFSQIENIDNTSTGININKAVKFNQQLAISSVPPQQENTTNIWFNKTTEELKIKINNFTYDLKPSEVLNSISIGTNTTFNLNGKRGIINDFTITGNNTVITVRGGNSNDWSILEVQGNLTVPTGCTLNLIRTPLIVRGNIIGGGTISSPDGVNGGLGGVGGPGGAGGVGGGYYWAGPGSVNSIEAGNGSPSPTLGSPSWTNGAGGSAISMPIEYGVSSGNGGPGGRGTGGGGGGGWTEFGGDYDIETPGGSSGSGSNPSYPGGSGNIYDYQPTGLLLKAGGGGGAGGPGSNGDNVFNFTPGGPSAAGTSGTNGGTAGILSTPYIGIGTPSASTLGTSGTSGGAGGVGQGVWFLLAPGSTPQHYGVVHGTTPSGYSPLIGGAPGDTGGSGGAGGLGGSTGGSHLTILCIGTIDASTIFRPGKGGINGGLSSGPKAQTGSLWLFSQYGTNLSPNASVIDLTGIGPSPSGSIGTSNRISTTDSTSVNSFFRDILYNSNGSTPAKSVIILTL